VNRVVPAGELMEEARRVARALAAQAPTAIRYILDAVHRGNEMPFAEGTAHEAALFGLAASTADMREGVRAFLEKRKPAFKGQ
jgi:enoyl-CoA hydratase